MLALRYVFPAILLLAASIPARAQMPALPELLGLPDGARPSVLADDQVPPPRLAQRDATVDPAQAAPAPAPTASPQRFVVEHVHRWSGPVPSAAPVTAAPQSAAVQVQPTPQAAAVVAPVASSLTTTATVIHAGPIRRGIGGFGRWLAQADQDVIRTRVPRTAATTTLPVTQALVTVATAVPAPAPAPVAAVQIPLPMPIAPTK